MVSEGVQSPFWGAQLELSGAAVGAPLHFKKDARKPEKPAMFGGSVGVVGVIWADVSRPFQAGRDFLGAFVEPFEKKQMNLRSDFIKAC